MLFFIIFLVVFVVVVSKILEEKERAKREEEEKRKTEEERAKKEEEKEEKEEAKKETERIAKEREEERAKRIEEREKTVKRAREAKTETDRIKEYMNIQKSYSGGYSSNPERELDRIQKTYESTDVSLKTNKDYRYGLKEQLCLFFNEHKPELSEEAYNGLLNEMNYGYGSDPETAGGEFWRESKDELCFFKERNVWYWDDERTEYRWFKLFSKTEYSPDSFDWSEANEEGLIHIKNIPCKGAHLFKGGFGRVNDYPTVINSEYLLLEPYGLNGVWFLHIYNSIDSEDNSMVW
jgi:hypothetical protein